MTLAETVTKIIKTLKTEASQLKPPADEKFLKALKASLFLSLEKAAGKIDEIIAGTDKDQVTPQSAAKFFKTCQTNFHQGLLKMALPKEATEALTEKLKTANTALTNAAKPFIKKMGVDDEEEEKKDVIKFDPKIIDPKVMKALKDHTELRQRGQKLVESFVLKCENFLKAVKLNRQRGEGGLELNRKLAKDIRTEENEIANVGDFFAGRKALADRYSKALDEGPYPKPIVANLRKQSEMAFEAGMRAMAQARDLRNKVLAEVQGHEMDVEKVNAPFLQDDNARLEHLKKIEPAINQVFSNRLIFKTEVKAWSAIEGITVQGIKRMKLTKKDESNAYRDKREEMVEAFEALPAYKNLVDTISRRLVLLMSGNPSEEVKKQVRDFVDKLMPIRSTIKLADKNQLDFELLCQKCDGLWEVAKNELELENEKLKELKELEELELN